jgi:uncharacterized membrane protein
MHGAAASGAGRSVAATRRHRRRRRRGTHTHDGRPGGRPRHRRAGGLGRERHRRERRRERGRHRDDDYLDRTTNWAVIVIAALLTWAFTSPDNPHYIILVGVATLSVFLIIESRRYRGYDIWRTRVRTIQENVWAYGLDPAGGVADEHWREHLGEDYRTPTLKITAEEAIAHRLRRVYLPLFAVLLAAWLIRITAFSSSPFSATAAIGMVPGTAVVAAVGAFYAVAIAVACRPRTWHAKGELRSEDLRKER